MSKRYSPQHKLAVLALLDSNGSVSLTAHQCGIPIRTLYTWERECTTLLQHARQQHIHGPSIARSARCLCCQPPAESLHSWQQRHPQELSCIGQAVCLHLQLKRFRCRNVSCPQKTFGQQFPDGLPAYARRTTRLTEILRCSAFEMRAEAAPHLWKPFQALARGDTVGRIIRHTRRPPLEAPQIVGLADWALKKRVGYGPLLVDLQPPQVIDPLLEPTATVVASGLKQHPSIALVARVRSTEYAAGVTAGAPQARQGADHCPLLLNLRQVLDRFLSTLYPRLQQLSLAPQHLAVLSQQPARTRSAHIATQNSPEKQWAKSAEMRHWRQAGYNLSQLADPLRPHWETVRNYYEATRFPERKQRRPGHRLRAP